MRSHLIITFFLVLSAWTAGAQDIQVVDRYDEVFGAKWAPRLTFRNVLLAEDYLMGLEGGIFTPDRRLSFFTSFDLRPFKKKLLEYQGGNLYYQYAEIRFFAGAGAEYLLPINSEKRGIFLQANAHYTWGRYGGTEFRPPKGWVLTPRVGFYWRFAEPVFLKAGYAYVDTKNNEVSNHRIYLAITGILSRPKSFGE